MSDNAKPAWMSPLGPAWTRDEGRLVYENPWMSVREHQAVAPTGRPALYGVVGFKTMAIAVLPLHDDGSVTLVGQHRFATRRYSWELPEGGCPAGEDPLEAAKRELREEAGLQAAEWLEVMRMELSNSITDERGVGFVALGLTPCDVDPDETEVIQIARRPFREALDFAMRGEIQDLPTVAMLLRGYHMAKEGLLPSDLAAAMLG